MAHTHDFPTDFFLFTLLPFFFLYLFFFSDVPKNTFMNDKTENPDERSSNKIVEEGEKNTHETKFNMFVQLILTINTKII